MGATVARSMCAVTSGAGRNRVLAMLEVEPLFTTAMAVREEEVDRRKR